MKKFIALFMCIALLAVCFVACGDQEEDAAGSDTTATTTAPAGGETTAPPAGGGEGEGNADAVELYGTDKDPYAQDLEAWD